MNLLNLAFAAFAVAQLAIVIATQKHARQDGHAPATTIITVIALALVYDNGMVAVGTTVGVGDTLATLSIFRFVSHILLTPILLVAAGWLYAQHRGTKISVVGPMAAVVLVMFGTATELLELHLVPATDGGILRYTVGEGSSPFAAVATVIGVIIFGELLRRAGGPTAMLAGGVAMFVMAGVDPAIGFPFVGNLGEVILMATMLMTSREIARSTSSPGSPQLITA